MRDASFVNDQGRTIPARATLQIRPGEAILVDVAAGAGKSLLLRIPAGGLVPQSGIVA